MISTRPPRSRTLAKTVDDNGGAYFVPAFSGLFAPYWRSDARGALVGLTRYVNKGHIARAALEATAFQTREVLDAVNADSGVDLTELKVDGGMIANNTLMQFQADILGVPVVRPVVAETTALGAAYAAGLAVGFWSDLDELRANWQEDTPLGAARWIADERDRQLRALEEGRHEDLRLGRRRRVARVHDAGERRAPRHPRGPSWRVDCVRTRSGLGRRDPLVELARGRAAVDGLLGDGHLVAEPVEDRALELARVLRELERDEPGRGVQQRRCRAPGRARPRAPRARCAALCCGVAADAARSMVARGDAEVARVEVVLRHQCRARPPRCGCARWW